MPDLVVAGAGMAGLAAAAQARELGAKVAVYEKGDRVGGSMLLSSGVAWRHLSFAEFRRDCPRGNPALQRLVYDNLDEDCAWLERLGARVVERSTSNPLTSGVRFCTRSLTEVLARKSGAVRLGVPLRELPARTPVVLATGGFPADRELVRAHITPHSDELCLRATPWSTGDGLRLGIEAGGETTAGLDEFYGRNMPAPPALVTETRFVDLAQLYARHAAVRNTDGERYTARTWSEIDVVQWTARQPRARAHYQVDTAHLDVSVGSRTISTMIAAAERAGASVQRSARSVRVEVVAGITATLGGLKVDTAAMAAPGVYVAGGDVGGIATGGYSSGLASALVLGRVAARSALEAR